MHCKIFRLQPGIFFCLTEPAKKGQVGSFYRYRLIPQLYFRLMDFKMHRTLHFYVLTSQDGIECKSSQVLFYILCSGLHEDCRSFELTRNELCTWKFVSWINNLNIRTFKYILGSCLVFKMSIYIHSIVTKPLDYLLWFLWVLFMYVSFYEVPCSE